MDVLKPTLVYHAAHSEESERREVLIIMSGYCTKNLELLDLLHLSDFLDIGKS